MSFECEVKTSFYSSRRLLGFLGEEVNLEFLGEKVIRVVEGNPNCS